MCAYLDALDFIPSSPGQTLLLLPFRNSTLHVYKAMRCLWGRHYKPRPPTCSLFLSHWPVFFPAVSVQPPFALLSCVSEGSWFCVNCGLWG